MKQEAAILLECIRNVLWDRQPSGSERHLSVEEYRRVVCYAQKQDLLPFLQDFDALIEGESQDFFERELFARVAADVRLEYEKESLLETFEENGIFCIPLKGIVTKGMYPSPELRTMGDLDILYKIEQTDALKKVMETLGYEYEGEASKHDHYRKQGIIVEMHKELLPVGSVAYQYYENIWERSKPEEGKHYIWQMTSEEHYLFTLCHLLEHFIRGGIGIRMVLDLYILSHQPGWNQEYILEQSEVLGIRKFEQSMRKLAEVWFGEPSERSGNLGQEFADLADYIVEGGTYGKKENESRNNALRYHSRLQYLVHSFFPSYKVMQSLFSWLDTPLLLPAAWIYRFKNVWTKRRKNIQERLKAAVEMEAPKEENVLQRGEFFEKYGLGKIMKNQGR